MGADLACLHADGRIRRVLLVAPACVDGDAWRSVVSRLAGAALIAEASGEAVGMLAPLAEPDPMLARYRGEGRCWTSATPVVVPGYDSLRGRLRPERSVRKLLRHAGVAEALLERAAFERGSRLRGSGHPLSCSLPASGSRTRRTFVRRDRLPSEGRAGVRGRRLDVQPSMSATLTPRILVLP